MLDQAWGVGGRGGVLVVVNRYEIRNEILYTSLYETLYTVWESEGDGTKGGREWQKK